MTSLVEAKGIAIPARLDPVDLSFAPGEVTAVVGPNGGGKTSLLRALAQVEDVEGDVWIAGERLSTLAPNRRERLVGFLPASREMVWPITVRDLVKLGLSELALAAVDEAIRTFELTQLTERRVDRLSTGERSRVLLARMFAAKPRLSLLDEPLANLDPFWSRKLLGQLKIGTAQDESAVVVSLHDLSQLWHFDRVIAIDSGSVAFDGTPSSFLKSRDFSRVFRLSADAFGISVS